MNQEMLCTWLGLPKAAWPPDPWTLLGVPRDVCDLAVIERRVQDRMCRLRSYQLSFPEEATEGMNRLAEAFITLTEACSKNQNVTTCVACPPPKPSENGAIVSNDETAVAVKTALDWRIEPPPVRQDFPEAPEPIAEEETHEKVLIAKPFAPPARPIRRTIDQKLLRELAEHSDEATSNLATLEAVIERVDRTRVLLHAWDGLGKQLKGVSKKVSTKESDLFAARLDKIARTMQIYPAFLGQPGKPGYRVVVQARLRMPLAMVRGMTEEQREELLFDWQAGRQVLLTHRRYLHRVFKSMRHRTTVGLFVHAVRSLVNDHPIPTLAGLLILASIVVAIVLSWLR